MIDFIIIGIILLAVVFSIRHISKKSKQGGCAGCSGCDHAKAKEWK